MENKLKYNFTHSYVYSPARLNETKKNAYKSLDLFLNNNFKKKVLIGKAFHLLFKDISFTYFH